MDVLKYIVLLSGGLDSVVNLYSAQREGRVVRALTFNYGQRSAEQEIKSSSKFCAHLNINHEVIDLPWLKNITHTALVNTDSSVPVVLDLDNLGETRKSAKAVWVPNRNGVFLNIAACYAEALNVGFVIPGFNKEEASTFPDNSPAFIDAVSHSLSLSTLTQVKVACFTSGMEKIEIVKLGKRLEISFKDLWSCYHDGDVPCGKCESCMRSARAFKASEIAWPWG